MPLKLLSIALAAATLSTAAWPAEAAPRKDDPRAQASRDSAERPRCRKSGGPIGLTGSAGGRALVGRSINRHGSRATGTILGAAAGALLGRKIERSPRRCD